MDRKNEVTVVVYTLVGVSDDNCIEMGAIGSKTRSSGGDGRAVAS